VIKTTINPSEYRIALLAGGNSTERDISIASGAGALAALEAAGFTCDVIDPANQEELNRLTCEKYDVAFLCLHGKGGEDGTIQAELESRGLKYTGSGVQASKLAIDKIETKNVYASANIPTPCSIYVDKELFADRQTCQQTIAQEVGYPLIVKAACEGSTIGIYRASCWEEAQQGIAEALNYDNRALVERFVVGEEFTVACLGNESPFALPVIQIVAQNGFYDFEAKYTPGGSTHLCPAPIAEELTQTMMNYACEAHRALGCAGMSRTDFIVDSAGEAWTLETNTIPGMTKTSLLPDAAAQAGISFDVLCTYLVELALQ